MKCSSGASQATAGSYECRWVVRIPGGALAGYVQATVLGSASALIAYELGSRDWRQGIGRSAVAAMLAELHSEYGVHTFAAVLKSGNFRSLGLLRSLGFMLASAQQVTEFGGEPDELVMGRRGAEPAVYGRPAMKVAGCQLLEKEGGNFYNTALAIERGTVVARYRKTAAR